MVKRALPREGSRSMQSVPKETTMFIRAVCGASRGQTAVAALTVLAVMALFALAGSARAAAPSNDDFANAITLTGPSGSQSGNNFEATAQAGEPNNHVDALGQPSDLGDRSVWYEWTVPASGLVGFDTEAPNTDFDTLLGVYTGASGRSRRWISTTTTVAPAGPAVSCSTPRRARPTSSPWADTRTRWASSRSSGAQPRGRRTMRSLRRPLSPVPAAVLLAVTSTPARSRES